MLELIAGIHRLRPRDFRPLGPRPGGGEGSGVLFITCGDLGVDPLSLFPEGVGFGREDLYVLQNAGHVVARRGPGLGAHEGDVAAALELYEVADVVVCGHSPCEVTRSLLAWGARGDAPAPRCLDHAARASKIVQEHYRHLPGDRLGEVLAAENVLVQLEHLLTIPAVRRRLDRGRLHLHGWLVEGGSLHAYDPLREQFVAMHAPQPSAR